MADLGAPKSFVARVCFCTFFALCPLFGSGSLWGPRRNPAITLGEVWGALGRLWGDFGESLARLWEAFEGSGKLWGGLGEPRAARPIDYISKLPVNQLCWPILVVVGIMAKGERRLPKGERREAKGERRLPKGER